MSLQGHGRMGRSITFLTPNRHQDPSGVTQPRYDLSFKDFLQHRWFSALTLGVCSEGHTASDLGMQGEQVRCLPSLSPETNGDNRE